ncbi:MAG: hypothetical protein JW834_02750 [Candidatus Diapherotrites archaeon]|nr:hypothetical protein [Candidatus Diapherotrites archaeon]
MPETYGSFDDFRRALPANWAKDYGVREASVRKYLEIGGIIKVGEVKGAWPTLVYPTASRLEKQLEEAERKLAGVEKQLHAWKRRHKRLKTNTVSDVVQRAVDPLFWEHKIRLVADPTYRETYDLVRPPMHLMNRADWRKKLKYFVQSKEYRIRLHEARTSKIGRRREKMDTEVEKRMEFNRQLADQEHKKLLTKKRDLEDRIRAVRALIVWARES